MDTVSLCVFPQSNPSDIGQGGIRSPSSSGPISLGLQLHRSWDLLRGPPKRHVPCYWQSYTHPVGRLCRVVGDQGPGRLPPMGGTLDFV